MLGYQQQTIIDVIYNIQCFLVQSHLHFSFFHPFTNFIGEGDGTSGAGIEKPPWLSGESESSSTTIGLDAVPAINIEDDRHYCHAPTKTRQESPLNKITRLARFNNNIFVYMIYDPITVPWYLECEPTWGGDIQLATAQNCPVGVVMVAVLCSGACYNG